MKLVFIGNDSDAAYMVEAGMMFRWPDGESLMAATAREGSELVAKASPDVVLLHTSFSDMSLQDAIQRLRWFPHTPLIVLSETDDEMEVIMALEMGADDYLRVPFDVSVLVARIGALLRRLQMPYDLPNKVRTL